MHIGEYASAKRQNQFGYILYSNGHCISGFLKDGIGDYETGRAAEYQHHGITLVAELPSCCPDGPACEYRSKAHPESCQHEFVTADTKTAFKPVNRYDQLVSRSGKSLLRDIFKHSFEAYELRLRGKSVLLTKVRRVLKEVRQLVAGDADVDFAEALNVELSTKQHQALVRNMKRANRGTNDALAGLDAKTNAGNSARYKDFPAFLDDFKRVCKGFRREVVRREFDALSSCSFSEKKRDQVGKLLASEYEASLGKDWKVWIDDGYQEAICKNNIPHLQRAYGIPIKTSTPAAHVWNLDMFAHIREKAPQCKPSMVHIKLPREADVLERRFWGLLAARYVNLGAPDSDPGFDGAEQEQEKDYWVLCFLCKRWRKIDHEYHKKVSGETAWNCAVPDSPFSVPDARGRRGCSIPSAATDEDVEIAAEPSPLPCEVRIQRRASVAASPLQLAELVQPTAPCSSAPKRKQETEWEAGPCRTCTKLARKGWIAVGAVGLRCNNQTHATHTLKKHCHFHTVNKGLGFLVDGAAETGRAETANETKDDELQLDQFKRSVWHLLSSCRGVRLAKQDAHEEKLSAAIEFVRKFWAAGPSDKEKKTFSEQAKKDVLPLIEQFIDDASEIKTGSSVWAARLKEQAVNQLRGLIGVPPVRAPKLKRRRSLRNTGGRDVEDGIQPAGPKDPDPEASKRKRRRKNKPMPTEGGVKPVVQQVIILDSSDSDDAPSKGVPADAASPSPSPQPPTLVQSPSQTTLTFDLVLVDERVTAQQHDSCQHHELKPLKDAGFFTQQTPLEPVLWKVKALRARQMLWTFIHSYQ